MKTLFLLFFFLVLKTSVPSEVYKRILGGRDCTQQQARYYVAICKGQCNTRRDIICGGTLIRPKWVLTAAHCDIPHGTLKVIWDAHNVRNIHPAMIHEVEKHIPHPNPHETGADFYFDIMLLKLKKPINRNISEPTEEECKSMNPLLTATDNPKPPTFSVAGHGICGYRSNDVSCPWYDNILQCFEIPWTQCPANWKDNPKYSKNIFCAGGGGKDTREGDSGGGLVINSTVYGIVQGGNDTDTAGNTPGIYINVCAFQDWMKKTAV